MTDPLHYQRLPDQRRDRNEALAEVLLPLSLLAIAILVVAGYAIWLALMPLQI